MSGRRAPAGTTDGWAGRVVEGAPQEVACPGGPVLLRGRAVLETPDGERHTSTRPVCAVCRCGRTAVAPWCDATHKLLPEADRPA